MITKIWKLAAILTVIALYALLSPNVWAQTDFTTSPHGVTFHTDITVQQPDKTPGRNIFNDNASLDGSQVDDNDNREPCTTDTDCVTRFPEIIPDANTIDDYWRVWTEPHFPTKGDCSRVDWLAQTEEGQFFVPTDVNHDGVINCDSDIELGA